MFRKLVIALTATAALAVTASSASAWHHHKHHHKHYGWGAFGAGLALGAVVSPVVAGYPYASNCYVVKRWVDTSYGPRLRRVTVCD
jgi:uncharacterized membrane protein YfcA